MIDLTTSREVHKKIKKAISNLERNSRYIALNVVTIAKKADVDVRTVKSHLSILEENGIGKFCDDGEKTFTTPFLLEKFVRAK